MVAAEEGLLASNTAKTIKQRGGKTTVTDGPFLDTKEQIGSFFIIEADTLEQAIEAASLHPAALMGEEYGFGIELRQIQE